MKEKELNFLKEMIKLTGNESYVSGKAIPFSDDKQLMYYLQKWSDMGWWDYGVSLRTGWFTDWGINEISKLKIKG